MISSVVQSSCLGSKSFLFADISALLTVTLAPRQNRQNVGRADMFGEDKMRTAECHPDRKCHAKGLCRECYHRNYRKEHGDVIKKYRDEHSSSRRLYDKARYLSNCENVKKRTSQYAKDHPKKFCEWSKKYRDANPVKVSARNKKYNSENKEKVSKRAKIYAEKNKENISKRQHSYYISNPEKERTKRLKKYGITSNDFDAMFASQNGLCAICGGDNKGKRLHVDHNHKTGKIRQLLCNACNVGLGSLKDDINILEKALSYLRKHDHDKNIPES